MEDHTQHHHGGHAGHNSRQMPVTESHNPSPASATTVTVAEHSHHGAHGGQDDHAVHSHGQHAGHSTAMFKNRFWLTLALSVPVVGPGCSSLSCTLD